MSYSDLQELRQGTLTRREDVIPQDMFRQIFCMCNRNSLCELSKISDEIGDFILMDDMLTQSICYNIQCVLF